MLFLNTTQAKMNYSWDTFCKAMLEMNNTEFYSEAYPELEKAFETMEYSELALRAIQKAIHDEKIDPTEALHDYLETLLMGARYALEDEETIRVCINKFLDLGATFPYKRLFDREYKDGSGEDEIYNYHVRGFLLDIVKPEAAKDITDWSQIEAAYWEEIEDDSDIDLFRFRYLKFCSDYLKSL